MGYAIAETYSRDETRISYARTRLNIEQISVEEQHRGSGVGDALLQAVEAHAKILKVNEISLDTWIDNNRAQSAFERFGFAKGRIWYAKTL